MDEHKNFLRIGDRNIIPYASGLAFGGTGLGNTGFIAISYNFATGYDF